MALSEPIGQPVRSLQMMLRTIAQYDNAVLPVIPDGIYAGDTVASVTSFQSRHGLPATGVTDLDTWYAIAAEFRRASTEIAPAEPLYLILQPGQVIRAGETNENLYMMHGALRAIGVRYPSMPQVACNDVHDGPSVEAIRWLQLRSGIEASGNITRETWKHLSRLYRITIGDGTRTAADIRL